jgi:signal transduction histidine kinase
MILIGIVGLWLVAILWVLLYLYFIRRTDRFMENWERKIKEKVAKSTFEGIQSLEEVAKAAETLPESIRSLKEAAEAIKASRKAMERFAFEKGFIDKPISQEIPTPESIIESQLETIASPSASFQFGRYESRKYREWEHRISTPQPIVSYV